MRAGPVGRAGPALQDCVRLRSSGRLHLAGRGFELTLDVGQLGCVTHGTGTLESFGEPKPK